MNLDQPHLPIYNRDGFVTLRLGELGAVADPTGIPVALTGWPTDGDAERAQLFADVPVTLRVMAYRDIALVLRPLAAMPVECSSGYCGWDPRTAAPHTCPKLATALDDPEAERLAQDRATLSVAATRAHAGAGLRLQAHLVSGPLAGTVELDAPLPDVMPVVPAVGGRNGHALLDRWEREHAEDPPPHIGVYVRIAGPGTPSYSWRAGQ